MWEGYASLSGDVVMYGHCIASPKIVSSGMFIRQVKKQNSATGQTFYQYQLVQASRIGGKVKQRQILYLGSEPALADKDFRDQLLQVLQAKIFGQTHLIEDDYSDQVKQLAEQYHQKYRIKYGKAAPEQVMASPPDPVRADYATVDLNELAITEARSFGGEHLCRQIADKIGLDECLQQIGLTEQDRKLAYVSIISRALLGASEHKTARWLANNSCLASLCGLDGSGLTHRQLYPITDKLYARRDELDRLLYQRITSLFDLDDTLVIYDLSNTYFETRKDSSRLARYGASKDGRGDCPQVVFSGVINAEGFIRYSRIYQGGTADVTTLADMVADLKAHSPDQADKTVVMDAGFASEANLAWLDDQGLRYVCVSRSRLADYPPSDEPDRRLADRDGNPIEVSVVTPPDQPDTWMTVRSQSKRRKEASIDEKLSARFTEELAGLHEGLTKKGTTKRVEKVWERIGRIRQKHHRVSGRYTVEVETDGRGRASAVTWQRKPQPSGEDTGHGLYFIRTNYTNPDAEQLWHIYNTIREVEASFRCLKSELNLRPIYHQNDQRVASHIYVTLLAYQVVNTIRYMLARAGIRHDWSNIVRIMNTQTLQTLKLPGETKTIELVKPSRPIKEASQIYQATQTESMIPAQKKSVVYH